jgi:ribosome-binding protein aMBF1 (putative translation factor)
MKCKICGEKTTWDTSVGRDCFIVCNKCVEKIAKEQQKSRIDVLEEILHKGFEMERR